MDGFTAIAEPTRRAILDCLRTGERDVTTLVTELRISQPLASKHLRVLREAGLVEASVRGKRRVYRLAKEPLPDVLAWIGPYARQWSIAFDRLEHVLESESS
ncbi:MAG: winged helix-turn-helix transcriptional regulator [Thermomicrobiales bacterium]|nr:winged helix-turn-helix transcriptional regulator [Thermomicrobiales bacterium]